jgi:hypothetical protein
VHAETHLFTADSFHWRSCGPVAFNEDGTFGANASDPEE